MFKDFDDDEVDTINWDGSFAVSGRVGKVILHVLGEDSQNIK